MDPVIQVYLWELAGASAVTLAAGLAYLFVTGNRKRENKDDGD